MKKGKQYIKGNLFLKRGCLFLLEMKIMKKLIICSKVLGALLIIIATLIATVIIVNLDTKISNTQASIDGLKDIQFGALIGIVKYSVDDIGRQIDYFQRNQMIVNKLIAEKTGQAIKMLEQSLLNRSKSATKQWTRFLSQGLDEDEKRIRDTDERMNEIADDENLSLLDRHLQIEKISDESQTAASKRLMEIQERLKETRTKKSNLENKRTTWSIFFVWFQIVGLIILMVAETVDGIIQIRKIN